MNASNLVRVSLMVSSIAASTVFGQGVGNLGSLPTQFQSPVPVAGWNVEDPATGGPIAVELNPTGQPWIKTLTGPNGSTFSATPGQTFFLNESLVVAPKLNWTDWHENILTPGWDWAQPVVFLANGVAPTNLSMVHTPAGTLSGGSLDFYFDPLVPGTQVIIRKQLKFKGVNGAAFDGVVKIAEYPTPEPASIGLAAIGAITMLRRRRATN